MLARVLAVGALAGFGVWAYKQATKGTDAKSAASSAGKVDPAPAPVAAAAAAGAGAAAPAAAAAAAAAGGIAPPNFRMTGWSQQRAHDLNGKVAFVTGGGGGIGRGVVEVLARCGCDVAIVDVNEAEAEKVAAVVRSNPGRRAVVLRADVRSLADMERAAQQCVAQLGALDICVANAGIVRTGSVLSMDEKRWHEIIDVNLTGTFFTVRACAREMVRRNAAGRIITISSANAVLAGAEGAAYCATKAGVAMMTRCWAQDLIAHDITVNCIGPGATDTGLMRAQVDNPAAMDGLLKLLPSGRMAEPEEVGWAVAHFASPGAAYLTGTFTLMDGGLRDHNADLTPALKEMRAARTQQSGAQILAKIDAEATAGQAAWLAQREKFALK